MGLTTIEWTATRMDDGTVRPGYTFNPWRGCVKVSPACLHCYAETLSKRNPAVLGEWGKTASRVPASESYWRKPLLWNRNAEADGVRTKVFCASLGDVFEPRPDLDVHRHRLWALIGATPHLDWLLLTKRPGVMAKWASEHGWPDNAWAGTTVENQATADRRIPRLLKVPARVRFLSMEPLLGPVQLWIGGSGTPGVRPIYGCEHIDAEDGTCGHPDAYSPECHLLSDCPLSDSTGIHWVIAGGESGPGARPSNPAWFQSLRDQCVAAEVPFLFKQWGAWAPVEDDEIELPVGCRFLDRTDGDVTSTITLILDEDGRRPRQMDITETAMIRVGKHKAGRVLDGRTWDGVPQ